MKKWIAVLLCLITLFSLAACGKREAGADNRPIGIRTNLRNRQAQL